jgi:hypothetical protein
MTTPLTTAVSDAIARDVEERTKQAVQEWKRLNVHAIEASTFFDYDILLESRINLKEEMQKRLAQQIADFIIKEHVGE